MAGLKNGSVSCCKHRHQNNINIWQIFQVFEVGEGVANEAGGRPWISRNSSFSQALPQAHCGSGVGSVNFRGSMQSEAPGDLWEQFQECFAVS